MDEQHHAEQLDRFIDALQADQVFEAETLDVEELADLRAVIRELRRERADERGMIDWPAAGFPERLTRDLVAALRTGLNLDATDSEDDPAPPTTIKHRTRRSVPTSVARPASRHRWLHETARLVAAIVLLAGVAGLLAAVFRNAPGTDTSQPSTQSALATLATPSAVASGGAATPAGATSSRLPVSMTASGLTVTLQMVDSTSSATRFYVSVALPLDRAVLDQSAVLGHSPADDVQIDGLNARASDVRISNNNNGYTQTNPALWLDYPSPFPSNRTVTLTIKQLWLPQEPASPIAFPTDEEHYTPTPVVIQAVTGPWVFHIAPAMLASQPLPSLITGGDCYDIALTSPPNSDCYEGVSATLAQKLVGFPVIEPTTLPSSLTRDDFGVSVVRLGVTSATRPNYVMLYYSPRSEQQRDLGVTVLETTDLAAVPTISGATASSVTPLGGPAQTTTILPGTLKTMNTDGVTVTRFEDGDAQDPVLHFVWTQGGVSYHAFNTALYAFVTTRPFVTDADLEQIVTSIIQQANAASPPATASPSPTPSASPPTGSVARAVAVGARGSDAWAVTATQFVSTTDGGAHWTSTPLPSGVEANSDTQPDTGTAVAVSPSGELWLLTGYEGTASFYRAVGPGKPWTKTTFSLNWPTGADAPLPHGPDTSVFGSDADGVITARVDEGITTNQAGTTGVPPASLVLVSTDEGKTFQQHDPPSPSVGNWQVSFTSATDGVIASPQGSADISFTRDGGATWHNAEVSGYDPTSDSEFFGRPIVDGSRIYVPANFSTNGAPRVEKLYVSDDGGETFAVQDSITMSVADFLIPVIGVNGPNVWIIPIVGGDVATLRLAPSTGIVYESVDNGVTWKTVLAPAFDWPIKGLAGFTANGVASDIGLESSTDALVWASHISCTPNANLMEKPPQDCSWSDVLLSTTDGGQHWQQLALP